MSLSEWEAELKCSAKQTHRPHSTTHGNFTNLAVVLVIKGKGVEGQYLLRQANQGVCRWFLNSPLVKEIGESLQSAIVGDDSIQRFDVHGEKKARIDVDRIHRK